MAEKIECSGCSVELTDHFHLCDVDMEGVWCCECFSRTPCGQGDHGESCETIVTQTRDGHSSMIDPDRNLTRTVH